LLVEKRFELGCKPSPALRKQEFKKETEMKSISWRLIFWIPACAGMTTRIKKSPNE